MKRALGLFGVGWLHQGLHSWLWQWGIVPEALRGHVYNLTGSALIVTLLVTVGLLAGSVPVWIAVAALIGHQAQVVGCTALYMWHPWPIKAGDSLCSDGLAGPLAVLGIAVTALMVRRYV